MTPIVISTVNGKGLPVLLESIRQYAPQVQVYIRGSESVLERLDYRKAKLIFGQPGNFGDDYNHVISRALDDGHLGVIVTNDDIVLTPSSYRILMDDVDVVDTLGRKVGLVGARSDAIRPLQNVRLNQEAEQLNGMRFTHEAYIRPAPAISPIFAFLSEQAFSECRFPPINYFGDDVICRDLAQRGYEHFVSAAYVHHIGSNTIGIDAQALTDESMPWLRANRQEYLDEWFKT